MMTAIIINEQGRQILEFIDNRRTVKEIIDLMIQKYPEVGENIIENVCILFYMRRKKRNH